MFIRFIFSIIFLLSCFACQKNNNTEIQKDSNKETEVNEDAGQVLQLQPFVPGPKQEMNALSSEHMQDAIQNNKAIIFQKSKSTIQFEAAKVSRKHKGSFSEFSAAIIFENNMPQEVVFDIDLRSVKSDDKELDKRLLGRDFFFTQRFPIASFHAKQFQKGKAEHYDVTGTLELRGVQKEITIPVQINNKNKKIQVISNFELNRKDFGIVYRGFPDDIIQDMVSVKLKLSN